MNDSMNLEIIKLGLQFVQVIAVVFGLALTIRQIKLLRQSYEDLHEWNRRKASVDTINEYKQLSEEVKLLNVSLNFSELNDPIPLDRIPGFQSAEAGGQEIRIALNKYLNYFESIAVSVRHGVLDERLVRDAFRTVISRALRKLGPYISHIRGKTGPSTWIELEELSKMWESQDGRRPRWKTGQRLINEWL